MVGHVKRRPGARRRADNTLPTIIVEVYKGVVQAVYSDRPVNYVLLDWDSIKLGDSVPRLTEAQPADLRPLAEMLKEAAAEASREIGERPARRDDARKRLSKQR